MRDSIYATLVFVCFALLHAALKVGLSQSYYTMDAASRPSQPATKENIPRSHQSIAIDGAEKTLHVSVYEGKNHEGERIVLDLI